MSNDIAWWLGWPGCWRRRRRGWRRQHGWRGAAAREPSGSWRGAPRHCTGHTCGSAYSQCHSAHILPWPTIPTDNGNLNGPPTLSHWGKNHTFFPSLFWAANGFAAVCTLDICRRYVDLIHVQKLGLRFVCRIKVGFHYLICQSDQQTTSH